MRVVRRPRTMTENPYTATPTTFSRTRCAIVPSPCRFAIIQMRAMLFRHLMRSAWTCSGGWLRCAALPARGLSHDAHRCMRRTLIARAISLPMPWKHGGGACSAFACDALQQISCAECDRQESSRHVSPLQNCCPDLLAIQQILWAGLGPRSAIQLNLHFIASCLDMIYSFIPQRLLC